MGQGKMAARTAERDLLVGQGTSPLWVLIVDLEKTE